MLETDRLFLREFKISDANKMWELNSDKDVLKYTGDKPFESIESTKQFIIEYQDYRKNGFGRWAVIEKFKNEFIGWCGLKLNEENLIDIGFRFFKQQWNKGYATEAAQACINYGFDSLSIKEIVGRADKENKSSIRVLEKLNMTFWKVN
ncbi:MAG: GNAT family N-acetyltransferase, partial [Flavobacteriaceae bacterium]|nr:GNAT family N-acetyltransferase [Flavobacteriaceae bacterium]